MKQESQGRFEIIRQLAIAASKGEEFEKVAEVTLAQTVKFADLKAAALILWDNALNPTLTVSYSEHAEDKQRLLTLEQELYEKLRKDKHLVSAYLSFGGKKPTHSFTLPLRFKENYFGAVIGMQEGVHTIVSEDVFLETLSALLALNYTAASQMKQAGIPQETLDQERLGGIVETAITVNHEVNNPLTAILGNVQLLLLKRDDLDDEVKKKLKSIEESAMKIKDITQRLMHITTPRVVEYTKGTSMLDLSEKTNQET